MTSTPLPDDDRPAFGDDVLEGIEEGLRTIPPDADEADVIEQHQELPEEDDAAPASGT